MSEPTEKDEGTKLGLSGYLADGFIDSLMTPLMLVSALLLGAIALIVLPREEEPQISVPLVDVIVQAQGLRAPEVVELITKPLEQIIKGISDVEHIYSQSLDDQVVVTARFNVGTDEETAIVRISEEILANFNRIPLGIPEPLLVGHGINDVPILVLTLTPKAGPSSDRWTDSDLREIADELQAELIKTHDVGFNFVVGGRPHQIRVEPDPEKLALYGITLNRLVEKVRNANRAFAVGRVRDAGQSLTVIAGQTLRGIPDIGLLLLTTQDGRPVYVKDVAQIITGGVQSEQRAWHFSPDTEHAKGPPPAPLPAVSIALAKRPGANAVTVAHDVLARLERVKGNVVPDSIDVIVTRDYGESAQEKADELIYHLAIATVSIVFLIAVFVGWREGIVVLIVIPVTILFTLFISWLLGYTINRVSMFALIFSIGILVDDAIVMLENIDRHWSMKDGRSARRAAVDAIAEVGNPTLIATVTVIAALMPMMFVSGLMGPYMSPIPANASVAMLFSFLIAVTVTPWLAYKLRSRKADSSHGDHEKVGILGRSYLFMAKYVLASRFAAWITLAVVFAATVLSLLLFATTDVRVKLLPFDNKTELQVIVDLPEGSSLEDTERVLFAAAREILTLHEITNIQAYAGTAAPFNFNGLVRHYYLRSSPELGDLQVNLHHKNARDRNSHAIAIDIRERLRKLDIPEGTAIKIAEVPPGPPVLSTLLAEVYGPDPESRRDTARKLKTLFEEVEYIVDVDDSFGEPAERLRFEIIEESLEFYGVEEEALYDTLGALFGGVQVGYSHRGGNINPVEIAISQSRDTLQLSERILSTPVPGRTAVVEIGDLVRIIREPASYPIFRRDGLFAELVTAEMAGQFEAPVYGMLEIQDRLASISDWPGGEAPVVSYYGQPEDESSHTLLWDGEWEVTYVTFRDMGAAFGVALLVIYLLLVYEFRRFGLPLVVLMPVPLTLLGIVFGHYLLGTPFTATSMIGFIALAGIVVRNSILLVDFINHARADGAPLKQALLDAGATRFRPIALTAAAAMTGAAFLLLDPIFQGLAVSLLFGLLSSTLLTVLAIPAVYVALKGTGETAANSADPIS